MSFLSQFMGGSGIKSIQRGRFAGNILSISVSTSLAATVDASKSILLVSGFNYNGSGLPGAYVYLYNGSTITIYTGSESTFSFGVAWQVIEYY